MIPSVIDSLQTSSEKDSGGVRVHLSFDVEHDADLSDLLAVQSLRGGSGFEVVSRSSPGVMSERWERDTRRRIRDADEVIVICGEHSGRSDRMRAELGIVREEEKPYFLLWGRREQMCSMPVGVDRTACMYSWTWETLVKQVIQTLRDARPLDIPENCKRA